MLRKSTIIFVALFDTGFRPEHPAGHYHIRRRRERWSRSGVARYG